MVSSSLVWYLCCLSWSDNLACASLISSCRFRFSSCNPLIFRSSPALSVRAFSWISLISFARDSLLCVARLLADSAAYIQCQNHSRTTSTSELTCAFLKSASAFNCKSRSSFSCRSPTKSLSCLMFSSSYFRVFSCTRSSSFSGSNQVSLRDISRARVRRSDLVLEDETNERIVVGHSGTRQEGMLELLV